MTSTKASALVLDRPRDLHMQHFDLPEVSDDNGLLEIEACGLCGTDHEQYTGVLSPPFAYIPGHEVVGVIKEIGDSAAERWGVRAGDRVAVEVFQSCRQCAACQVGAYNRCERHGFDAMYGYLPVDHKPSLWGGYSSHLYLSPDALVLPIPDQLDPIEATLFNPLGAGIRWGVTLPQTKPGDVVTIFGPGIRGLSALIAVQAAGAAAVVVVGRGPRDADRLRLAKEFGATAVVDVSTTNPVDGLLDAVGQLSDVVVHVAAHAPPVLGQAVDCVKTGGRIVVAGVQGDAGTPGFHPDQLVRKEITILGAMGVDTASYQAAIDVLAKGDCPLMEAPRETVGFDSLEQLLKRMAGEGDTAPPVHGVFTPR